MVEFGEGLGDGQDTEPSGLVSAKASLDSLLPGPFPACTRHDKPDLVETGRKALGGISSFVLGVSRNRNLAGDPATPALNRDVYRAASNGKLDLCLEAELVRRRAQEVLEILVILSALAGDVRIAGRSRRFACTGRFRLLILPLGSRCGQRSRSPDLLRRNTEATAIAVYQRLECLV